MTVVQQDNAPAAIASPAIRALAVPHKIERVYNYYHSTLHAMPGRWRARIRSSRGSAPLRIVRNKNQQRITP
jgi:hypothetical protein